MAINAVRQIVVGKSGGHEWGFVHAGRVTTTDPAGHSASFACDAAERLRNVKFIGRGWCSSEGGHKLTSGARGMRGRTMPEFIDWKEVREPARVRDQAIAVLANGGCVGFPAETGAPLAARSDRPGAPNRIDSEGHNWLPALPAGHHHRAVTG